MNEQASTTLARADSRCHLLLLALALHCTRLRSRAVVVASFNFHLRHRPAPAPAPAPAYRAFRRPMRQGEYSHPLWQVRRGTAERHGENYWRAATERCRSVPPCGGRYPAEALEAAAGGRRRVPCSPKRRQPFT
jgi:hypothetical protein